MLHSASKRTCHRSRYSIDRVHGSMLQDGVTKECKPLVDFLRAQLVGNHQSNAAIFLDSELTQPRSAASLIRHRNTILASLSSSPPSRSANSSTIQGMTIQDLRSFMEVARDVQSVESATQTQTSVQVSSVEKRWKVNLPSLLKFAHVTMSDSLAPIWTALGGKDYPPSCLQ